MEEPSFVERPRSARCLEQSERGVGPMNGVPLLFEGGLGALEYGILEPDAEGKDKRLAISGAKSALHP